MSVYGLDDDGKEPPSEIRDQLLSLRRLDAESDELDRKLQEVRKRRDAVYHQLERYCKNRAPIRRVPYEVLSMIFSNHSEAQKSRNSSIIRVCKLWRRILMETPSLWNHISLDIGRIEELPLLWAYARTCLIRSNNLPLYLRLNACNLKPNDALLELGVTYTRFHFAYVYSNQSAAKELLRPFEKTGQMDDEVVRVHESVLLMTLAILRGEGDRFLTSEVDDPEGARLWDSMDGITDNLVDLVFSLKNRGSYLPDGDWHPKGFQNLNSLRAFSTSLDVKLDQLALPIATMERLSLLHDKPGEQFLWFASDAFTKLRLLELKIPDYIYGDNSIPTIRLPALEVLALSEEGGYDYIMGRFDAPNLTHLCLKYLPDEDEETPSIFHTITDIMLLSEWRLKIAEMGRLLSSTPCLRRFHIRQPGYGIQAVFEEMRTERPAVEYTCDPGRWPYVIPTWDS